MTVGYDPDRVRRLDRLTLAAIDECARLRSTDPAAADALRTVRLARRNLEDLWMPALRDIERSEAMVSWTPSMTAATVATPEALGGGGWWTRWTPLMALTDRELIDEVVWTNAFVASNQTPAAGDLEMLAKELGRRADTGPAFADHLVNLARTTPLVGQLAEHGQYSRVLSSRLLVVMLRPHDPVGVAARPMHRSAIEALMAELLPTPGLCLDVLMTPGVVVDLIGWAGLDADVDSGAALDPDLVSSFVVGGLHGAVADDPTRLADSFGVLTEVIWLTNGPLDSGLPPSVALAVATSMVGFVDTLAPALRHEGRERVVVVDEATGLDLDIGSYDDLVDLIGALLREPEAQAALGTVLGGYTVAVVERLGADLVELPGVEHVARFADLIADAGRTEQVELVLEAAAEEARLRQLGNAIGFGANALLTAAGADTVTRLITSRAIALATDYSARVDPPELPDARLPAATYDLISVTAVAVVVHDPVLRQAVGLDSISRSDRAELARQLEEFTTEADVDERGRRARRLDRWIEAHVPALGSYLLRVRSLPAMDELTEARTPVDPD